MPDLDAKSKRSDIKRGTIIFLTFRTINPITYE